MALAKSSKINPTIPKLSLLERPLKTGLGDAYKDAIKRVIADKDVKVVITMDADGSHQPKYLKIYWKILRI